MILRGHVPRRTCIACRKVRPKGELLRIVRTPNGEIKADPEGKMPGRGAYVCPVEGCFRLALKQRKFERALGKQVEEGMLDQIPIQVIQAGPLGPSLGSNGIEGVKTRGENSGL